MICGLDVGGTNIKAGLVHNGRVIKQLSLPTKASYGFKVSIQQIKMAIHHFLEEASAIGIGIAGIIDSEHGIVRTSPNLKGWQNIRLGDILKKEFTKPAQIINDVNAILLAEWQYGAGKGYQNIFLFTLGTGVGGAAICEGKMLFGASGFAGEFGHTTIKFDGPKCLCGNYGCLERFVGTRAIISLARRKRARSSSNLQKYQKLSPKIIAEEAKKGDRLAWEVFDEIGYYLGIGVSNIINLLDPEVVIISGGIARAGRMLLEPIRKATAERVVGGKYRRYKIVSAKLGNNAGILGAAYFASQLR